MTQKPERHFMFTKYFPIFVVKICDSIFYNRHDPRRSERHIAEVGAVGFQDQPDVQER